MPTFVHGRNTAVLIDQFDFSGWFREVTSSAEVEVAETTAFDAGTKPHKSYITGFSDGTLSLSGMFDGTADAIDEEINARLGQEDTVLFSVAPKGFAVGNRAFLAQGRMTSYEVTSPVSDIVGVTMEAQADLGLRGAYALHNITTAETATGNATSVDETASSTNGGAAHLHVITATGTTPSLTVKLQHSTDNSVWADLLTFTAATAVTKERLAVSAGTTINRYVRAQWTISGTTPSFKFALVWARY